jgi:hypothetical protein
LHGGRIGDLGAERLSRFHPPGRRPSAAMTRAPACASTRTH